MEGGENVKFALHRTRRGMWNFQCIFNTLFILFFILSSVGLWTCLLEINKLKQTTDSLLELISVNRSFPTHKKIDEHKSVSNFESDELHHQTKTSNDFFFNSVRGQFIATKIVHDSDNGKPRHKRSALPTYQMRDPLSSQPSKDMVEYCRNVVYDICRSTVPGAPGTGFPGPPGPPGSKGEPGTPGPMGHIGPPGLDGQKGHKGDKGETGRVGEPGADGPRGPPGYPGTNGIQGPPGRRGKRGMPGKPGKEGDDGVPGMPGLKGQKGEPGDPGGTVSYKGGNCTCVGIKGEKGQRGLVGFDGYTGDKGEPGEKGEKGYGSQGYPGPRGPEGQKGEKGDPGYCRAVSCGDKYVRQTPSLTFESYTNPAKTTTTTTKSTTTTQPTTTPTTIPPTLEPRTTVCRLKKISTPVFIKRERSLYGSILGDAMQPAKFWVTRGYYGQYVEQYDSLEHLKDLVIAKRFNTRINRFYGTQHAVYDNSFYYQFLGKPHIVRYDLELGDVVTAVKIADSHYNDSNYLYKESRIYFDITADENGLWIVYGRQRDNRSYIHVAKADLLTLDIQRVWRLPLEIGVYKNGFIACGILYLIKDLDPGQMETEIDFAYDLYQDEMDSVNIKLKIPFGENAMFTFYTNSSDRKNSVLLAWDKGNIIKYPLLF